MTIYIYIYIYIYIERERERETSGDDIYIQRERQVVMIYIYIITTCLYHLSLSAGLSCYILYQYRAVVGPQEYIAYKFILTSVFEMSGSCPYCCYFVGCCLRDLFSTPHSILVQLLSTLFSIHLVRVHAVHLYSIIDTTTAYIYIYIYIYILPYG